MMKSRPLRERLQAHGIRAKYYAMRKLREGPSRASGRSDGANALPAGGQVCYFTGSSRDQPSWTYEGHSVFTAQLCRLMRGPFSSWETLHQAVSAGVAGEMTELSHLVGSQLQQDPQVSYAFIKRLPLLNTPVDSGPTTETLADILHLSNPDPNALSLEMLVDTKSSSALSLPKGSELVFHAQARQAGYLVMLNRHVDGKIAVIFPKSLRAADGYMTAGDKRRIPENQANSLFADDTGMESVKAILFGSQAEAQQTLDRFRADNGKSEEFTYSQLSSRKLREGTSRRPAPASTFAYFTAETSLEIREP